MKSLHTLLLALFASAVLLALRGPAAAGDGAAPADVTPATADLSIEGTTWVSQAEGPDRWNIAYTFDTGGILVYSYNGTTYRNGTWTQDGDTIYLETNKKYRECKGTIRGDQIEADSWNVAGSKWKTSLTRQAEGK